VLEFLAVKRQVETLTLERDQVLRAKESEERRRACAEEKAEAALGERDARIRECESRILELTTVNESLSMANEQLQTQLGLKEEAVNAILRRRVIGEDVSAVLENTQLVALAEESLAAIRERETYAHALCTLERRADTITTDLQSCKTRLTQIDIISAGKDDANERARRRLDEYEASLAEGVKLMRDIHALDAARQRALDAYKAEIAALRTALERARFRTRELEGELDRARFAS
jgi:chromosome segregation ATPase